MSFDPSRHAGDRSFERDISGPLAQKVINEGAQSIQDNGHIMHQMRDPDNIDHIIKVVTTPHPKKIVTVIRDTSKPYRESVLSQQQHVKAQAEAKSNSDKSKANRKAQLEKKRLRSAAANNKNK
jgi:hypothetical protein